VRRLEPAGPEDGKTIIEWPPGLTGPWVLDALGELFGCCACPRLMLKYDTERVKFRNPDGNPPAIRCPRCDTLNRMPASADGQ
jgi:hypothetical protein